MEDEIPEIIPVFPLPNIVLFPLTRVPIYVFEPRYVRMVESVLGGDKIIGIFLLKGNYTIGHHNFYSIGCAGKITAFTELPGKRYSIILTGLYRIAVEEVIMGKEYQMVTFKVLDDKVPKRESVRRELKAKLLETAKELFEQIGEKEDNIRNVISLGHMMRFEETVNWACLLLGINAKKKQKLLEIEDVAKRCKEAVEIMRDEMRHLNVIKQFEFVRPRDPRVN